MINLIQADLYKMRKSTAMKVLFAITTVCAVIMTIFAYLIPQGKIPESYTGIGFLFSDINMMSILGAAVAGIFICGDFDNKTIHDAITSGCSRIAIICSKAITFFIAVIILVLPYAIITGIALLSGVKLGMSSVGVGFLHLMAIDGGTAFDVSVFFKMLAVMLTLILVYIAQLSLCVPFALIFKKPVVVIVAYYSFTLFCAQLYGLSNDSEVFKNISSYTPYGGNHTFLTLEAHAGNFGKTIIVSLVFITLMMVATYSVFRKSEIK
jgi:ABC-2 type transport system permease protein